MLALPPIARGAENSEVLLVEKNGVLAVAVNVIPLPDGTDEVERGRSVLPSLRPPQAVRPAAAEGFSVIPSGSLMAAVFTWAESISSLGCRVRLAVALIPSG